MFGSSEIKYWLYFLLEFINCAVNFAWAYLELVQVIVNVSFIGKTHTYTVTVSACLFIDVIASKRFLIW